MGRPGFRFAPSGLRKPIGGPASLRRLDAQRLSDRGDLGALVLDRGGQFGGGGWGPRGPRGGGRAGAPRGAGMSAAIRSRRSGGMSRQPKKPPKAAKASAGNPASLAVGT